MNNIKALACSIVAVLFLMSCDSDTSILGGSVSFSDDIVNISSDTCFATSRSVATIDSLLMKTTLCTLGQYTDPLTGSRFSSGYLTQLNCIENFHLPDSIYGIGDHKFPDWFIDRVGTSDPYYANIRLYFQDFFGDSLNTVKIDVFILDKMLDGNKRYYHDLNPKDYYDENSKPVASALISALNLLESDSLRATTNYQPSLTFRLPDSIAYKILSSYYTDEGRGWFANSTTFMQNLCKGFYVRCTQGDGSIFYIYKTVLEVNFKCITYNNKNEANYGSYMAEFTGNEEVLQVSSIEWTGLDDVLNDNNCSWIKSPCGVLTEIALPVDEMKKGGTSVLNSAKIILSTVNTPSQRFKPSAPGQLLLIRRNKVRSFFDGNNKNDDIESFIATFDKNKGTYTYGNIADMVEKMCDDRSEWLEAQGLADNQAGKDAYAQAHPDWNKVVLIPVLSKKGSTSQVISYIADTYMHQVKLAGGSGRPISIFTISSNR